MDRRGARLMLCAAVLLTGIGRDGAEGLRTLRNAGWTTIAQDARTSVVYGMPKAAAAANAAVAILPLQRIAPKIIDALAAPAEKGVIA